MKPLDQNKIHATMRSIYRFLEFKNMESLDILIDTERDILHQYFIELTAEEIVYILTNFEKYQKEQNIQNTQENEKMTGNINRYLLALN